MSVVQLLFTFLTHRFSKCSPLFPIYGTWVQIVRMLLLFTMFFSCFGASLQIFFNKDLRIWNYYGDELNDDVIENNDDN